jgi:ubiquitin carboxyl-terminal hydrolase 7
LNARVVTEETYRAHSGTDLATFDDPDKDPAAARTYRLRRASTVQDLTTRVAEDIGQDPRKIRFWCMVNRQNKTIRPDQPITDLRMTIEDVYLKLAGTKLQELRLWVEVLEEADSTNDQIWSAPASPLSGAGSPSKSENILLFLKWFDIEHQMLRGAGHLYMGKERKVEDLVPLILKKMGWPEKNPSGEKTQLRLYEEIKPQMIDSMKGKQTLKAAELQDGDIVCFQRIPDAKASDNDKESVLIFPFSRKHLPDDNYRSVVRPSDWIEDAREFYDYLLYRKLLRLLPHPRSVGPKRDPLDVEMSSKFSYDQMAAKVGEKLDVEPTHLRFHTVNASTHNPKTPIKRNLTQTLQQILTPPYSTFGNNNQRADMLYFEILDMSLSELDTKKNLKVTWLSEGITKDVGGGPRYVETKLTCPAGTIRCSRSQKWDCDRSNCGTDKESKA